MPASIARTGVQTYTDAQGRTVREYRAPDVVFDEASLATLASIPVTVGHPGAVDSRNWRRHAVGHVSDAPPARRADGATPGVEWLDAHIVIQDADALRRIEAGELVEVSMGYLAEVVPQAGVTPAGEHYDAVQRGVKFNHLALLPEGKARAGSGARLRLDGNEEPQSLEVEHMKVKIDGIEYDFGSASHVQALEKQRDLAVQRADAAEAKAKDAEAALGPVQAKADAAEAKVSQLEAAKPDVDALVQDELAFRALVAPALPKDYAFAGRTRDQVRADAVGAEVVAKAEKLPDAARAGYLQAHLELKLAAPAPKAPLHAPAPKADAVEAPKPERKDPVAEAYKASWSK